MASSSTGSGSHRHRRVQPHIRTRFRRGSLFLRFYADTDHSGAIEQSEEEWRLRMSKPGAILMFNCDRDGATAPALDYEDETLDTDTHLRDFTKLVIKRNASLPVNCEAIVTFAVPGDADKVRAYDLSSRAAVLGRLAAGNASEYILPTIRNRDCVLAFEGVQRDLSRAGQTIELRVKLRQTGRVRFDQGIYFTVAPWLLLSNVERAAQAYVADVGDATFVSELRRYVGGRLHVITHPTDPIEQWVQDVIEIGFSSTPATINRPMHQLINSRNIDSRPTRLKLFEQIETDLVGANFGHIKVPAANSSSLNSFGNLEVTPPLPRYPFGRIFYGETNAGYSAMHNDMDAEVTDILDANPYQPPVRVPTNWLVVGHVDEFLSFVPAPAIDAAAFRLLMPSPALAIRLCRTLQRARRGGAMICAGKGAGYEISINDFLGDVDQLLTKNQRVQAILNRIRSTVIRGQLGVSNAQIVELPVLFNADLAAGTNVDNAIARTAGMVNCLVLPPTKVIVPEPFGPRNRRGHDVFKQYADRTLRSLGLNPLFIDDWATYHAAYGEVHCGTNVKRIPPSWRWWQRNLRINRARVHQ